MSTDLRPTDGQPIQPDTCAALLSRAAHLMRQLADAATDDTGSAYWFTDQAQGGRQSVISEHIGHYVVEYVREGVGAHVARWDPNAAVAVAGLLELTARLVRARDEIDDQAREAMKIAHAFMRAYGEPV
jgi:hypothetical protein